MNSDGLDEIEFGIAPLTSAPTGSVVLQLLDVTDAPSTVVRRDTVPAAGIGRDGRYRFMFEPIRDSAFRQYDFQIRGSGDVGLALVATKGVGYPDGALAMDSRRRWADLVFQTFTEPPVRSTWAVLWTAQRDSTRLRDKLIVPLLALNWLVAGVAMHIFVKLLIAPSAAD